MAGPSRRWIQKLFQLRELTPVEWGDLGRALLLLPVAGLSLKLFGFEHTQRTMTRRVMEPRGDGDLSRARAMARMVALAASHGPYRTTCLRKALVLRWMLARIGIAAELKIGVRKGAAGGVEAHAWVEAVGGILLDSGDVEERFAAFEPTLSPRRNGKGY